jgi:hypothetical protein
MTINAATSQNTNPAGSPRPKGQKSAEKFNKFVQQTRAGSASNPGIDNGTDKLGTSGATKVQGRGERDSDSSDQQGDNKHTLLMGGLSYVIQDGHVVGKKGLASTVDNSAAPSDAGSASPDDGGLNVPVNAMTLSIQQRRDQAIAGDQGDALSAELRKNIALKAAKAVGSAVDLFGQVALPSLFTNKFLRSAVSQIIQNAENGQNVSRNEIQQLADDIVGEMIDKATLTVPREKIIAGANVNKDAAIEAITNTLIEASRNVKVPGASQSAHDAIMGFIAARAIQNARPNQVQVGSSDEMMFGKADHLKSTTIESFAESAYNISTAISNVGRALLNPVGTGLNETTKAAITLGISSIAAGLATGNFQVMQFESQSPNLNSDERALSAIISQPAKTMIMAIQVQTPGTRWKYPNSRRYRWSPANDASWSRRQHKFHYGYNNGNQKCGKQRVIIL